jgi:NADH:ubiquinone oxidoreductase subunit 5 (subunit L)/multisubunit Na+/H+ antiporter MnhA subunit
MFRMGVSIGVMSYMLIDHYSGRREANKSGIQAILVNKV